MFKYGDKLGKRITAHFDLPGNTKLFSAWKQGLDENTVYSCTIVDEETITAPIFTFKNFTMDSIKKKLCKNFNTLQKRVLMIMDSAPGNERVSNFVRK